MPSPTVPSGLTGQTSISFHSGGSSSGVTMPSPFLSSSLFVTRPSWFLSYFSMKAFTARSRTGSSAYSHVKAGIIDCGSVARGFQWCA
jgi:hypothetical protein